MVLSGQAAKRPQADLTYRRETAGAAGPTSAAAPARFGHGGPLGGQIDVDLLCLVVSDAQQVRRLPLTQLDGLVQFMLAQFVGVVAQLACEKSFKRG